jgi:hypothetical protein
MKSIPLTKKNQRPDRNAGIPSLLVHGMALKWRNTSQNNAIYHSISWQEILTEKSSGIFRKPTLLRFDDAQVNIYATCLAHKAH